MSLFSRFFGRRDDEDAPAAAPVIANRELEISMNLAVLFAEQPELDAAALTETLRQSARELRNAQCEVDTEFAGEGTGLGLFGWGRHVVRAVIFPVPLPAGIVEPCIAPAHYSQELKRSARAHKAQVLLYYAGYETSPYEQYIALGVVAAALGKHGGLVVLNEAARTSVPAGLLSDTRDGEALALLRNLPLPLLFCGFVKLEVEGFRGVWMRTYGAPHMGLPDLAAHAAGHEEAERYFDAFDGVFLYVRKTGVRLGRGHTMQIGSDLYARLRAPKLSESFLDSEGELFVLEPISADQINR